ncbi:hypothetical protein SARC_11602 [Sphaeroforma arctica JP610]|uniref:F-box domain-containing protein n=1 Tax=Sphaeroforma arctica JP610 TaxID=667725 RepID=A0A0L0FHD0_9EUKA|nr:hypothetical protein SARC_11602 [Sphaeroforma arctica JP610]KNC75881.1 hypothetical protein SARC_11602 [Sphaeroforma arctica JP610]|eukprot:XP_014149783.1 hypothetical protein SARC_11602 [Sphaeroforma arctica JP610]
MHIITASDMTRKGQQRGPPTDLDSAVAYLQSLDPDTLLCLQSRIPSMIKSKTSTNAPASTRGVRPTFDDGWLLPADVVHKIFDYLSVEEFCTARYVCKSVYYNWPMRALPGEVYETKGKLHKKSIQETCAFLSRYPLLKKWDANSPDFVPEDNSRNAQLAVVDQIAKAVPNVTHLDALENSSLSPVQVDHLVYTLPLTHLYLARWIPADVSTLTHLEVRHGFSDYIEAPPVRSLTLKYLKLPLTVVDNSLLANCPNLQVLLLDNAKVSSPLTSSNLIRLEVGEVDCIEVVQGLTSLDRFAYAKLNCSKFVSKSVTVIQSGGRKVGFKSPLDLYDCTALTRMNKLDDVPVHAEKIEEVSSTGYHWIGDSVLPNLTTLTLKWANLTDEKVRSGVISLVSVTWAKNIRKLNLNLRGVTEVCTPEWRDFLEDMCDAILLAMPNLESFRIDGFVPAFLDTTVYYSSMREFTLEYPIFDMYSAESLLERIHCLFPSLEILRIPVNMIYNFTATHFLDCNDARNVKYLVPHSERENVSVKFEELVQQDRAGYYLPLRDPDLAKLFA